MLVGGMAAAAESCLGYAVDGSSGAAYHFEITADLKRAI
jgi:hypothetical protein